VNVFCALSEQKVYGLFFFVEKTITGAVYLDVLENWLWPQLAEDAGQETDLSTRWSTTSLSPGSATVP
jgi:hypothetical protein